MEKSTIKNGTLAAILAAMPLLAIGPGLPVLAQDQDNAETGEFRDVMVVTSQRREESLQDVPISVRAFDGDFLEKSNVTDFDGVADWTPGLTTRTTDLQSTRFIIRGIGTSDFGIGSNPATALYVDDVYIGRSGGSAIDLLDIERVEVLKGPQGTLFGVNAIAGAISVTTRKPGPEFEATATIEAGNFDRLAGRASLNIPLIEDKLFTRIMFSRSVRDGYVKNAFPGGKDFADDDNLTLRAALRFLPSDTVTVDLVGELQEDHISGQAIKAINFLPDGTPGAADPFTALQSDASDITDQDREVWGLTGRVDWEIGEYTFSSISAYRTYWLFQLQDDDGTALPGLVTGLTPEENEQWSQEIRLVSPSDRRLRWFLGASFLHERAFQRQTLIVDLGFLDQGLNFFADFGGPFGIPFGTESSEFDFFKSDWDSYAVYGDVSYNVTDALELTVGLRYGYDEKEFGNRTPPAPVSVAVLGGNLVFPILEPEVRDSANWDALQPRFVVNYNWTNDVLVYASVSRGYKAGGFTKSDVGLQPFEPEFVWSYEVGAKTTSLDGRLVLNGSAFYYDYTDLQINTLVDTGAANIAVVQNAGQASGYGIELEANAYVNDNFSVFGALSWIEAEFDEFVAAEDLGGTVIDDRAGNALPLSPEFSVSVGSEYRLQLEPGFAAILRVEGIYNSEAAFASDNVFTRDDFFLFNARLTLAQGEDEQTQLTFFIENAFDERYVQSQGGLFNPPFLTVTPNRPRFYGIKASYSF